MGLIDDIKRGARSGPKNISSSENLVIEQTLNKLFYLDKKDEEEVKFLQLIMDKNGAQKERFGLHASAIITGEADFCYKEQVLSLLYKQAQGGNIDIGLKRIFEEGNAVHEKWQRLFLRGDLGKAKDMDQSRFNKKYELSYTPDIICTIGKHKYVGEIKSVNTFQFKKMQTHPSGKKQLMLYMHLTGIHKGFVLCDDKNCQEFKIFITEYDESFLEPYIIRLEQIQYFKKRALEDHRMVRGICKNAYCKRALKCNMRDACYNINTGRIKL